MGARPSPSEIEGDLDNLFDLVRSWGQPAEAEGKARLAGLAEAICRWNEAINLVSRKDIGRLVSYHFCDSASILPIVGRPSGLRVLDVGGSNGLPGLVLAALLPQVDLTICDARKKRRGFLEEVCGGAGAGEPSRVADSGGVASAPESAGRSHVGAGPEPLFGNARFEMSRVDSETFRERHRGKFDLILARAVTQMRLLVRWCMPLLGSGGRLVAYKGSRCRDEVRQAEADIFGHGGAMAAVVGSPWAEQCNPLRRFAIAGKA